MTKASDLKNQIDKIKLVLSQLTDKNVTLANSPDIILELLANALDANTAYFTAICFLRSKIQPSTPVGGKWKYNRNTKKFVFTPPITEDGTWSLSVAPVEDDEEQDLPVWMSTAIFSSIDDTELVQTWSDPVRISGTQGVAGSDGTDGKDGADGEDGVSADAVFKSVVFKRSTEQPDAPSANDGSYASPIPTGWSDGIPAVDVDDPILTVWMSSRIFTSSGYGWQQAAWSTPVRLADSTTVDFEFSAVEENPGNPTLNSANWHDAREADENDIWMAVRYLNNGIYSEWAITKIKGEDGVDGVDGDSYYRMTVYCRVLPNNNGKIVTPSAPTGGTWDQNISKPTGWSAEWTENIPEGEGILFTSYRIFSFLDSIPNTDWSTPIRVTDTVDIDYEYNCLASYTDVPIKKYPSNNAVYKYAYKEFTDIPTEVEEVGEATGYCDVYGWMDEVPTDLMPYIIYRAECKIKNSEYVLTGTDPSWVIVKVAGKDGNSISIKGVLNSQDELPSTGEEGDAYTINGNLWVWNGESWTNAGNIKGEKGQDGLSSKVKLFTAWKTDYHDDPDTAVYYTKARLDDEPDADITHMGTYVIYYKEGEILNFDDLEHTWENYTWVRCKGEDAFGVEYMYKATLTANASQVDIETNPSYTKDYRLDNALVEGWSDDIPAPLKDGVKQPWWYNGNDAPFKYLWRARRVQNSDKTWPVYENNSVKIINSYAEDGENGVSKFKSTVFTLIDAVDINWTDPNDPYINYLPTGGTFESPIPATKVNNELVWHDSIPEGTGLVYASSAWFSSDSTAAPTWSTPTRLGDSVDVDINYNILELPLAPLDGKPVYDHHYNTTTFEIEENVEGTVYAIPCTIRGWINEIPQIFESKINWIAISKIKNGEYLGWEISKIKGEDGKDGVDGKSVDIQSHIFDSLAEFEASTEYNDHSDPSDAYLITHADGSKHLYIWDGDSWFDSGAFSGIPGTSMYMYVAYAPDLDSEGKPTAVYFDAPNKYIAVITTTSPTCPEVTAQVWQDAKWSYFRGEDGFGWEYIYKLGGADAPTIPSTSAVSGKTFDMDDFVPTGWSDNPKTPNRENADEFNCWAARRQKKSDNPNTPATWHAFGTPYIYSNASISISNVVVKFYKDPIEVGSTVNYNSSNAGDWISTDPINDSFKGKNKAKVTITTLNDGTIKVSEVEYIYIPKDGENVDVVETIIEYYASATSMTTAQLEASSVVWNTAYPATTEGMYVYTRTTTIYSSKDAAGNNIKTVVYTVSYNGASPYNLVLSNEYIAIPCDADGNKLTMDSPTCSAKLYKGSTQVPDNNVTYSVTSSNVTGVTIKTNGTVNFASTFDLTADAGSIKVKAAIKNTTLSFTKTINVVRQKQGTGEDAVYYKLILSADVVTCDPTNNMSPSEITVTPKKFVGGVASDCTTCVIETSDGTYASGKITGFTGPFTVTMKVDGQIVDQQSVTVVNDGKVGKIMYNAGEWSNAVTYTSDDYQTPMVLKGGKYYYLLVTTANTTWTASEWKEVQGYEALYAKLAIVDGGMFGNFVISKDFMFSTEGLTEGGVRKTYTEALAENYAVDCGNKGIAVTTAIGRWIPNFSVNQKTGEIYSISGNIGGFDISTNGFAKTKSTFGFKVTNVGATKVKVIRAICTALSLGLKEGKNLVDTGNYYLSDDQTLLNSAKTAAEAEGATCIVKFITKNIHITNDDIQFSTADFNVNISTTGALFTSDNIGFAVTDSGIKIAFSGSASGLDWKTLSLDTDGKTLILT